MAEDVLETVRSRNEFYRDNYRRVMMALLLMVITATILAGGLIYLVTNKPGPKYFAVNPDGSLVRLVPMNQPNVTDSFLLQWSNMVSTATYTYNFTNYVRELQAASAFFTDDAWRAFAANLRASGNIDLVKRNKYNVSAVATGAPVIVDKGIIGGTYSWTVQMPMLVTFESASDRTSFTYIVTMKIVRVPTRIQPRGIAIAQFIAEQPR